MSSLPTTPDEYRQWWDEQTDIPYGYCWCGCGAKTYLARRTSKARRWFRGEPLRFISGHNNSAPRTANRPHTRQEYKEWWSLQKPGISYGLCWCGCGKTTSLAATTDKARLFFGGQPTRYIPGHQNISSPVVYEVEDWGYVDPCWIWKRGISGGYGVIQRGGKKIKAHRYFYEAAYGPIPNNLTLDHLCVSRTKGNGGSTACINPEHLEAVTPTENHRRAKNVKLTNTDVNEIRELLRLGKESEEEIAKKFGVQQPAISKIKLGRTWRGA